MKEWQSNLIHWVRLGIGDHLIQVSESLCNSYHIIQYNLSCVIWRGDEQHQVTLPWPWEIPWKGISQYSELKTWKILWNFNILELGYLQGLFSFIVFWVSINRSDTWNLNIIPDDFKAISFEKKSRLNGINYGIYQT